MAISGDYSQPVSVNGYQCWNCTDVANAKKGVDPQHPKSGPYGIDARDDPTVKQAAKQTATQTAAVIFGGSLSDAPDGEGGPPPAQGAGGAGTLLDVSI